MAEIKSISNISVVILTYNEELNLENCLKGVSNWVSEIFVVDSYSTDKTLEIAQKYGCKIFQHKFENQAQQFNWALDNFVEVGKFILKNYSDSQIVVFGGPSDFEKGEYLKKNIGNGSVVNLCGKLSLLEGAFIINKLKSIISNNTGLMHMASLAGKNVITIFSAAELDGKWFPHGENSRLLMKRTNCEGCYYKKCPYDYKCIKSVKPAEVIEIIKKLRN